MSLKSTNREKFTIHVYSKCHTLIMVHQMWYCSPVIVQISVSLSVLHFQCHQSVLQTFPVVGPLCRVTSTIHGTDITFSEGLMVFKVSNIDPDIWMSDPDTVVPSTMKGLGLTLINNLHKSSFLILLNSALSPPSWSTKVPLITQVNLGSKLSLGVNLWGNWRESWGN